MEQVGMLQHTLKGVDQGQGQNLLQNCTEDTQPLNYTMASFSSKMGSEHQMVMPAEEIPTRPDVAGFGLPKLQIENVNSTTSVYLENSLVSVEQHSPVEQNAGAGALRQDCMDANETDPVQITENKKMTVHQTDGCHSQATTEQQSSTETASLKRKIRCLRERERRKEIRTLCNELNFLVPSCDQNTDTISILRKTCTYLKSIREANVENDFGRFTYPESCSSKSQYQDSQYCTCNGQ
ncbi:uncharacterized protein LOC144037165 isoform X3 [Vanacampus margaritifer]